MAAAVILKNQKIHISAAFRAILTKLGLGTQFDPLDRLNHRNLKFQKSEMAAAAILKNRKLAAVLAISTKFGRVTQFGPCDRLVLYKFEI